MSLILVLDEIELNTFITVHSGIMDPEAVCPTSKPIEKYGHYKGIVLKIVAIDSPYIVVEYYVSVAQGKKEISEVSIDTREVKLMKLSDKFVQKAEPNFKILPYETSKANWVFDQEEG